MEHRKILSHYIVATLVLLLAFSGLLLITSCKAAGQERDLKEERINILRALDGPSSSLQRHITIEERQDENGTPYLVGVLTGWADEVLEDLVDAYNADPSTKKMVTLEEVRFDLTEGLAQTSKPENLESPTRALLHWCDSPAELEYAMNLRNDDGVLVRSEGDPVKTYDPETKQVIISNYSFVAHPDAYRNYRFVWQGASG